MSLRRARPSLTFLLLPPAPPKRKTRRASRFSARSLVRSAAVLVLSSAVFMEMLDTAYDLAFDRQFGPGFAQGFGGNRRLDSVDLEHDPTGFDLGDETD